MRVLTLGALATATFLVCGAAQAQTYAPGDPVCLKVYGPVGYDECRYTTMAQCNASASGRPAQCYLNPYLASAEVPPVRYRHHHSVY